MVSQHPHTYIIADSKQENPANSQDFSTESASPTWVDPELGISTKAYFKTEELSGGVIKETFVIRHKKEYSKLTPETASTAAASRSDTIGPSWKTRKTRTKEAKSYIWGGQGRKVLRATLTLPSEATYQQHHPKGLDGIENDSTCRAQTMAALKSLRLDLEEKDGALNAFFGGVEYTKKNKAHVNIILDITYPAELSNVSDLIDYIDSHFSTCLIKSKRFLHNIASNHKSPSSVFSSTSKVQEVKREGYPFHDALAGAIEYVSKTDRHKKGGHQQNPDPNIPHHHKGCRVIKDFSGLEQNIVREDIPDEVNPYDVLQQLSNVAEEEGWVAFENSPGEWVVQRVTEPAPEPALEAPSEPSKSSPRVNVYEELAGTSETHLWPNMGTLKPVPHRTMVQAKRVALQYIMFGTGCQNDSLPSLCSMPVPTAPAAHHANPLLPTGSNPDAPVVSNMMPTAPAAHPADSLKQDAAPSAHPDAPAARPRDSTCASSDDDDEPP